MDLNDTVMRNDASIQSKGGNYLYWYILYWIVSSIILYVIYKYSSKKRR